MSALVANTTVVNTRDAGFTTVYPAGTTRPLTSNLNATDSAQLIANHTIVPVGVRGIAFYSQKGSHIVVDVTGWYTGTPQTSSLAPPTNPTPAPPPLPDAHRGAPPRPRHQPGRGVRPRRPRSTSPATFRAAA